jgi:predicted TIM-barrel fold metal-dependent hydrolase
VALNFSIVDAHVHLWDLDGPIQYPWLQPPFSDDSVNGSVEPIAKTYRLDDYLADAAGFHVAKIVHVDAGARPEDALAETGWLQATADARRMPNAIVAFAALNDPQVERLLEQHVVHPNVRGIRHIINWHPDPDVSYTTADLLHDPQFEAGYALLRTYGLSYDLQIYPNQMRAAAALAARHPDVPVVLNHAGMPVERDEAGLARWREGLRALAALPHVAVKISGLGLVMHDWTTERLRPLVLETLDIFGPDRCMFASDFPTDKLYAGFARQMEAYDEITSGFSEDERRALFAGNAERLYRI